MNLLRFCVSCLAHSCCCYNETLCFFVHWSNAFEESHIRTHVHIHVLHHTLASDVRPKDVSNIQKRGRQYAMDDGITFSIEFNLQHSPLHHPFHLYQPSEFLLDFTIGSNRLNYRVLHHDFKTIKDLFCMEWNTNSYIGLSILHSYTTFYNTSMESKE